MIPRILIIKLVSISLVALSSSSVILDAAHYAVHNFVDAVEEVEKEFEPVLLGAATKVGNLMQTSNHSWQYMQDVFNECLEQCLVHFLDEDSLTRCFTTNKENCKMMKNLSAKDLTLYYSTLLAGSKAIQVPGRAISTALGLQNTGDDEESSMSKRAIDAGIQFIKTSAAEKITEEVFDAGKRKVLGLIQSFDKVGNDLGNAILNGKNALEEMVESGKKLPQNEEAIQLKSAVEDGKNSLKTALQSSKNIAMSVATLPLQSSVATGNYAIDVILDSGISFVKSEDSLNLQTAIDDGKNAITSILKSGQKLTESVNSIPSKILTETVNCSTGSNSGSTSTRSFSEDVVQIKNAIGSGKNAVGDLVGSSRKLAQTLAAFPLKSVQNVGNFALDNMLESGLKIAKSDEAMLLNAAILSGKNLTDSVLYSGSKLVGSALDIPLRTASNISQITLSTTVNSRIN